MSTKNQLEQLDQNYIAAGSVMERAKTSAVDDSSGGYKIHVASSAEEINRWREFWNANNRHPDADIDFYSLVVSSRPEELQPHIMVATKGGQPRAMLVGLWEKCDIRIKLGYLTVLKLGIRQLGFLQDGFLGESSPEVARAMAQQIMRELKTGSADRAYFYNTDVNLDIYNAARSVPGFLLRDHSTKTAERWKTALPANMDEFLKRRSKKHRYWLRRIGRVFEEAFPGQVQYKEYRTTDDIRQFCEAAEKVAQTTYQRGLGVGFLNTPQTHRRLELAAKKGWLRAYVCYVSDEPVAFWCGRLYDGVMYLDWTGYKPALRKYEVGTVLFLKMLEDLCKSGAREVDYGTGTAGYKERFGDHKSVEGFVSMHPATVKGLVVNVLTTADHAVNTTMKKLAKKLGIVDRLKKLWRGRSSREEVKTEGAEGEAGESAK